MTFSLIFCILFSGSSGILEFALIYDEINQLLLVNILRAKVRLLTQVRILNKLLTDIVILFSICGGLTLTDSVIHTVKLLFNQPLKM